MLKLYAKNNQLDIEDLKFSIVRKCPLDLDEGMPGDFVFNFSIPATDRNNQYLDHPYRLTKFQLQQFSSEGKALFEGLGIAEGLLKIVKATSKIIELKMNVDSGAFNSLIRNVMLSEIFEEVVSLGSSSQDVVDHAVSKLDKQYPETDYNFPTIYNPKHYGQDNEFNKDYLGFINRWDFFNEEFFKND